LPEKCPQKAHCFLAPEAQSLLNLKKNTLLITGCVLSLAASYEMGNMIIGHKKYYEKFWDEGIISQYVNLNKS
jgi:hypothetical protein